MNSKLLPVHEPSRAYAQFLCTGIVSQAEKWQKVTAWVSKAFTYDFVRAFTTPKKNGTPDLERCWNLRMGICLDIASLTVGMLRACGINAYMVWGHADNNYHAWVEATISGKTYRYDHENIKGDKVKTYKKEKVIG